MAHIIFPKRWTAKPPIGAQIDWGHPLAIGLEEAWVVGDSSGAEVLDSARGRRLAISSGAIVTADQGGLAVQYLAATPIRRANRANVPYHAQTSFVARMQRITTGAASKSVASHHTTDGSASDWYLYFNASDNLVIDIPWVLGSVVVGSTAVTNLAWRDVGFTRSGVTGDWTYKVFYEGIEDGSATTASNPNTSDHDMNMGNLSSGDTGKNFGGNISYGYRYSRPLAPVEIEWIHHEPFAMFVPQSPRPRYWFVPAADEITLDQWFQAMPDNFEPTIEVVSY